MGKKMSQKCRYQIRKNIVARSRTSDSNVYVFKKATFVAKRKKKVDVQTKSSVRVTNWLL